MGKLLSEAQVAFYRAQGYLFPIDALGPEEAARARAALGRTRRGSAANSPRSCATSRTSPCSGPTSWSTIRAFWMRSRT